MAIQYTSGKYGRFGGVSGKYLLTFKEKAIELQIASPMKPVKYISYSRASMVGARIAS